MGQKKTHKGDVIYRISEQLIFTKYEFRVSPEQQQSNRAGTNYMCDIQEYVTCLGTALAESRSI